MKSNLSFPKSLKTTLLDILKNGPTEKIDEENLHKLVMIAPLILFGSKIDMDINLDKDEYAETMENEPMLAPILIHLCDLIENI